MSNPGNLTVTQIEQLMTEYGPSALRVMPDGRVFIIQTALLNALKGLFALHEPEGRFQPSHYKPILRAVREAISLAEGGPVDHEAAYNKQVAFSQLLFEAEEALRIIDEHRLAGADQNPKGFRDTLYSAVRVAKGFK